MRGVVFEIYVISSLSYHSGCMTLESRIWTPGKRRMLGDVKKNVEGGLKRRMLKEYPI